MEVNNKVSTSESEKYRDLHFNEDNGPVDRAIEEVFRLAGGVNSPEIIREMILAALKAGQENPEMADLKLMNSTLKEMRYTSKVFCPYRRVRKVTVFGSARTERDKPIYHMAREFGARLAEEGYMVITGGGPGIMEAVNEGAGAEHSFGVNIRLPFEQKPNHVIAGTHRDIVYKYFFNRKVAFIKQADAIALFPGGFGTMDEAMETLTLLQTGKSRPLPLVLMDVPGGDYWTAWESFLKDVLLVRGYIDSHDFSLFEQAGSIEEAVEKIDRFYARYHSLRYVGEKMVIRLSSDLSPSEVRKIKDVFADLLLPGGDLYLSGPLPEERNEAEIIHLPRLVVDFNKRDFGRLRELIDALNSI